jgi:hypothetical protein
MKIISALKDWGRVNCLVIQHYQLCIDCGAFQDHTLAELASFHFIALAGVDVTAHDLRSECGFLCG